MSEARTETNMTLNGVRVRAVWDGDFRVWLNSISISKWIGEKHPAPEDDAGQRADIISEIWDAIGNGDLPDATRDLAAQALTLQVPAP